MTGGGHGIGNRPPVGVILAGGLASRMGGGDKGLRMLGEMPVLRRVVEHMRCWTDVILLSANDDPARFAGLDWLAGVEIVVDTEPGRPGPLAGILAAMDRAVVVAPDRTHLLCVPCDTPFLPANLWPLLAAGLTRDAGTVAMALGPDGTRHPTVSLWPLTARDTLHRALREEGLRKVGAVAARLGMTGVPFPAGPGGIDPFFNINGPDDLVRAEEIIRSAVP